MTGITLRFLYLQLVVFLYTRWLLFLCSYWGLHRALLHWLKDLVYWYEARIERGVIESMHITGGGVYTKTDEK